MTIEDSPPPPAGDRPYAPVPLSPHDERLWATLAHVGGMVVPFAWLIIYLVYKDRSRFVRLHSGEALNLHISLLIYESGGFLAALALAFFTWGISLLVMFLAAIGVSIFALVTMILGAVAANQGREYRYPLILRLVN